MWNRAGGRPSDSERRAPEHEQTLPCSRWSCARVRWRLREPGARARDLLVGRRSCGIPGDSRAVCASAAPSSSPSPRHSVGGVRTRAGNLLLVSHDSGVRVRWEPESHCGFQCPSGLGNGESRARGGVHAARETWAATRHTFVQVCGMDGWLISTVLKSFDLVARHRGRLASGSTVAVVA